MIGAELQKSAFWGVLSFLASTNEEMHANGLAKRLKISASSAHGRLKSLEKDGIVESRAVGNIILYSLRNTPIVFELKKIVFLLHAVPFFEKFAGDNKAVGAMALYGSMADGTFDRHSDIDLLVISQEKKLNFEALERLEFKEKREVKAVVYSVGEWRKLAREKNPFFESVAKKHITVWGELE